MVEEHLVSEDLKTLLNALELSNRLLNTGSNSVMATKAGIVGALSELAERKEVEVRDRVSQGFQILARYPAGKESIVKEAAIPVVVQLAGDESVDVRRQAADTLASLSSQVDGCEAMIKGHVTEVLVKKSREEKDEETLVSSLIALGKLVSGPGGEGLADGLKAGGPAACTALLQHKENRVVAEACNVLFHLGLNAEGKTVIVKEGAVARLTPLLRSSDSRVKLGAAQVLMILVVDQEAKAAVVEAGVENFGQVLDEKNRVILIHLMRFIGGVTDHPKLRKEFVDQDLPEKLDKVIDLGKEEGDERLVAAAEKTKSLVTWIP